MIIHGSPVMRCGLAALLPSLGLFRVCAETDDVPTARDLVEKHRPDLIVIGLTLRHGDGIRLINDLRKAGTKARMLVLSNRSDPLSVERAFRAGARGYMAAHDELTEMPRALAQISSGEFYASPSISRVLLQVMAKGQIKAAWSEGRLSDRELEVFRMIGRGQGTSRIARELHLSVKTIETHRMRIQQKLGLADGAELNRRAAAWLMNEMRERRRLL